jgi:hypothetical protein
MGLHGLLQGYQYFTLLLLTAPEVMSVHDVSAWRIGGGTEMKPAKNLSLAFNENGFIFIYIRSNLGTRTDPRTPSNLSCML